MAEINHTAANSALQEFSPNLAQPQGKSFDDLMELLGNVKVWARQNELTDLAHAMEAAEGMARTGWSATHEALFHLAFAHGHAMAGRGIDASRSIGHAEHQLKRWNGRRATFPHADIAVSEEAKGYGLELLEGV